MRQTFPPSCFVFKKSGNLNFLEPSGPLQASNGTALPFTVKILLRVLRETPNAFCRDKAILTSRIEINFTCEWNLCIVMISLCWMKYYLYNLCLKVNGALGDIVQVVCFLLGNSSYLPASEDGTDRVF
jgi:hypothetical protein